jgi:transcriptional regulator with XRE-family HTH domain
LFAKMPAFSWLSHHRTPPNWRRSALLFVRNSEHQVKSVLLSAVAMNVAALFRRRVRRLILEKYRSLDRFYLETDFSKGHLSEILRGKGSPSVSTLIKLARALEVELCDFFIFPEASDRDRATELLRHAAPETVRRVLQELSPKERVPR